MPSFFLGPKSGPGGETPDINYSDLVLSNETVFASKELAAFSNTLYFEVFPEENPTDKVLDSTEENL